MKLIAVSVFAMFALTTVACGKKADPAPAPAAEKKVEAAPAPAAEKKVEAAPVEAKPATEVKAVEAKPAEASALPAVCQKYLDNVKACAGAMPEAARGQFLDALKKTEEAWAMVPKDQMESSCKMAWDAGKQGMAAACPNVKWE